jgi:hypothetical protein
MRNVSKTHTLGSINYNNGNHVCDGWCLFNDNHFSPRAYQAASASRGGVT